MPPSTDPADLHWTGIRSRWGLFIALGIGLIVLGLFSGVLALIACAPVGPVARR